MPAPCAKGIFLHANYSPFDGRYRADRGPIHATCTPDWKPIRKAPAQPNATPPASDGARPNQFTTRVCRSRRPKRIRSTSALRLAISASFASSSFARLAAALVLALFRPARRLLLFATFSVRPLSPGFDPPLDIGYFWLFLPYDR